MKSTVGNGENTINITCSFSNNVFKAYLTQPLWFCVLGGVCVCVCVCVCVFKMHAYKIKFAMVINIT